MSAEVQFGLFVFFAVTGLFCLGYIVYAVLDSIVSGNQRLHRLEQRLAEDGHAD